MNKKNLSILVIALVAFATTSQAALVEYTVPYVSGETYAMTSGIDPIAKGGNIASFNFDITDQFTPTNISYTNLTVVFSNTSKSDSVSVVLWDSVSENKTIGTYNISSLNSPLTIDFKLSTADLNVYVKDDGLFSLRIINNNNNPGLAKKDAIINGVTAVVPIPGAAWLLGAGLVGLIAIRRKNR